MFKSYPKDNSKTPLDDMINDFLRKCPNITPIQLFDVGMLEGPTASPRETMIVTMVLYEESSLIEK